MVHKATLEQVVSEYLGFPRQISLHRLFHAHHHLLPGAGAVGQIVANLPSGLSLTPPEGTELQILKVEIFPLEDGHNTETCSGYWIKYSNQCCVRRKPWTWTRDVDGCGCCLFQRADDRVQDWNKIWNMWGRLYVQWRESDANCRENWKVLQLYFAVREMSIGPPSQFAISLQFYINVLLLWTYT
jgi:hypothetical protein